MAVLGYSGRYQVHPLHHAGQLRGERGGSGQLPRQTNEKVTGEAAQC